MELLQLRYFCDAAESESFSKTARKYIVPPSNISQCIKRLEKELGTELFIRRANRVILNESGEKFYRTVSAALANIDTACAEAKSKADDEGISISVNTNRRLTSAAIEKFKRAYPGVALRIAYFGSVEDTEYDLVIDSEPPSRGEYETVKLMSENFALAMNADNKFASAENLNIAELRSEAFISMDSKTSLHKITQRICRDYGFEPRIALQTDDPLFVRQCVELGLGIAFVPMTSWNGQFADNVVLKKTPYQRESCAYILASSRKKQVHALADFLIKELKNG